MGRLVSCLVAPAPISEPTCSYSGWSTHHWQFLNSRTLLPLLRRKHVQLCTRQPRFNTPRSNQSRRDRSTGKCSSFLFTGQDNSEGSSTLSSSRTEPQLPTAQIHILTHLTQVFPILCLIPTSLTRASGVIPQLGDLFPSVCLRLCFLKHKPRHAPRCVRGKCNMFKMKEIPHLMVC